MYYIIILQVFVVVTDEIVILKIKLQYTLSFHVKLWMEVFKDKGHSIYKMSLGPYL